MSQDLADLITQYVSEFGKMASIDNLKVKGPFDLTVLDEQNLPYWGQHHNDHFGEGYKLQARVYVIASGNHEGFYIGSSIGGGSAIGNRLWGYHFGPYTKFKEGSLNGKSEIAIRTILDKNANPTTGRFVDVRFLFLVLVPNEKRWLASALESFLIEKMDPPWNILGRKRKGVQ